MALLFLLSSYINSPSARSLYFQKIFWSYGCQPSPYINKLSPYPSFFFIVPACQPSNSKWKKWSWIVKWISSNNTTVGIVLHIFNPWFQTFFVHNLHSMAQTPVFLRRNLYLSFEIQWTTWFLCYKLQGKRTLPKIFWKILYASLYDVPWFLQWRRSVNLKNLNFLVAYGNGGSTQWLSKLPVCSCSIYLTLAIMNKNFKQVFHS